MYNDSVWVDMIDDWVRVGLCTCCENDYIEMFAKFFKNFFTKWSDFNKAISHFALKRTIGNLNLEIRSDTLVGMNQSLIHIKHNSFSI